MDPRSKAILLKLVEKLRRGDDLGALDEELITVIEAVVEYWFGGEFKALFGVLKGVAAARLLQAQLQETVK